MGAARHSEYVVGQAGTQCHQAGIARGPQQGTIGPSDDVVVGHDAAMKLEFASRGQSERVVAPLAVDQQPAGFHRLQCTGHHGTQGLGAPDLG